MNVEYGSPTFASGIVVVAIDTAFGATTTIAVAVPCAWGDVESRTVTRIVKVPCVSGWPAIVPDDASKPRPAGSDPDVIAHVYGPSPPLTVSDPAYGEPTTPEGRSVPMLSTTREGAGAPPPPEPPMA